MRRTLLITALLALALASAAVGDDTDTTPPVITPAVSGTPGANGWYTSNVDVSWTVTDPESAITNTSGCGDERVTGETAGRTLTCTATNDANLTASESVTIKVDKSAPSAAADADRPPDAAGGWYRQPVTFTFNGADEVSGASCSAPVTYSGPDGESASVSGTCTNGAGLVATATANFKYDATAPTVTIDSGPSGTVTSSTATFTFSASGATSGFTCSLDGNAAACSSPVTYAALAEGPHTFSVSASDDAGNTGTDSRTFTVADASPPETSIDGGPSGLVTSRSASFTFSSSDPGSSFECKLDGGDFAGCSSPASYSDLPDGGHTFSVRAKNAAGNTDPSPASQAWSIDATPPTTTIHSGPAAEEDQRSATFTFSAESGATFACSLDGSAFSTCSSPQPYSALADGSHTFSVRATDAAGNTESSPPSWSWTIEIDAPVLTLPANRVVEADGPTGSVVTWTASATQNGEPLPPGAVACIPASGGTFGLGTTLVTCTATGAESQVATGTFNVSVLDRTPPVITPPPELALVAAQDTGVARTDPAIVKFLSAASVADIVDLAPALTNDAPLVFPVGKTTVTFTAVDDYGNSSSAQAAVTVAAPGSPPPPPPSVVDFPPGDVTNLKANPRNREVTLSWSLPADQDLASVNVFRAKSSDPPPGISVYQGRATQYRDRGLENGTEYRYVVVSFDQAGNRSSGVAVSAIPRAPALLRPPEGARLTAPPRLVWLRDAAASYYNVQLYRGKRKILSLWPRAASLKLKRKWRYGGRSQTLSAGAYTWFVWPGYGDPRDIDYGDLLGQSTFTIKKKAR